MSESMPAANDPLEEAGFPDHLVLRDIRVFRGEHLRGDLHVVPEGLFFLRESPRYQLHPRDWFFRTGLILGLFITLFLVVSRLPNVPDWLAGAVGAALSFALHLALPRRKTRPPEPPWRLETAGIPLDRAVERLPGSFPLAWDEAMKAVSSPGMIQLWHEGMRRTLILDLLPLPRRALVAAIRARDIPIDGHREKPPNAQRFTVSFEGATWWRRTANLVISPSSIMLEIHRGSSHMTVGLSLAIVVALFIAGLAFMTLSDMETLGFLLWLVAVAGSWVVVAIQDKIDRGEWRRGDVLQRVTCPLEEISELRVAKSQLWMTMVDGTRIAVEIGEGQEAVNVIRTLALVAPDRLVIEPGD